MGRASRPQHFDVNQLTADDHRLLAAFEQRRTGFQRFLDASNILYHKHTCPTCGLPTLDTRDDHEACVVCLWVDGVGEADPTLVAPPNYVSMTQARVDAAAMLAEFERTHEGAGSLEDIVRSVRDFTRRLARGEVRVDREDFAANLRGILGVTRRGA